MDVPSISKALAVATLSQEAKDFVRENPKLRDSVVIKFAQRYDNDREFDVISSLKGVLEKKRQGAKSGLRLSKRQIKDRLQASGKYDADQIGQIIDTIGISSEDLESAAEK